MITPHAHEACTHTAEYQALATATLDTAVALPPMQSGEWYAYVNLPIDRAAERHNVCLPVYGNRLRRSEYTVR